MKKQIEISTSKKYEIVDLTDEVENFIKGSGAEEGFCLVFTPHATASLILNENEPGLLDDIILQIQTTFSLKEYKHDKIDDNAQAHLAASFFGQGVTIPVIDSKPALGIWQSVLFIELDGPRSSRRIIMVAK